MNGRIARPLLQPQRQQASRSNQSLITRMVYPLVGKGKKKVPPSFAIVSVEPKDEALELSECAWSSVPPTNLTTLKRERFLFSSSSHGIEGYFYYFLFIFIEFPYPTSNDF